MIGTILGPVVVEHPADEFPGPCYGTLYRCEARGISSFSWSYDPEPPSMGASAYAWSSAAGVVAVHAIYEHGNGYGARIAPMPAGPLVERE